MAIICPKCGTENIDSARFCINCGTKLTANATKPSKQNTPQAGKRTNAYLILSLVFLVALFIVLLILKGNSQRVAQKAAKVQQRSVENAQLPENHPSMEKMQKIQALKDSLKMAPNDYHLLVSLANNYFDINRFDLAIAHYKKALQLKHPKDIAVMIDLGVAYFNAQKLDSALYFMDKALTMEPNHALALLNKGVILFNLGKIKKSIEVWNRVITLHPNSTEASNAREFVKQAKLHLEKQN